MERFSIDWILRRKIAIGSAPSSSNNLDYLSRKGIKSILSLCDENEFKSSESLIQNFVHRRVVLKDHRSLSSFNIEELCLALDTLSELMKSKPVYIHCLAGFERSPLVCMGWLVREEKIPFQNAVDYTMQMHPGTNPLPEHLGLLRLL